MRHMRITSKGQITVPKKLRDRFGITAETELEFREDRGRLVLVKKAAAAAIAKIRGRVRRLPIGADVDEYLRLTRGGG